MAKTRRERANEQDSEWTEASQEKRLRCSRLVGESLLSLATAATKLRMRIENYSIESQGEDEAELLQAADALGTLSRALLRRAARPTRDHSSNDSPSAKM